MRQLVKGCPSGDLNAVIDGLHEVGRRQWVTGALCRVTQEFGSLALADRLIHGSDTLFTREIVVCLCHDDLSF
jgi:hypothetical protein